MAMGMSSMVVIMISQQQGADDVYRQSDGGDDDGLIEQDDDVRVEQAFETDSNAMNKATPPSRIALVKPPSTSIFHVPNAKRVSFAYRRESAYAPAVRRGCSRRG